LEKEEEKQHSLGDNPKDSIAGLLRMNALMTLINNAWIGAMKTKPADQDVNKLYVGY
jgi:hypothetical protein